MPGTRCQDFAFWMDFTPFANSVPGMIGNLGVPGGVKSRLVADYLDAVLWVLVGDAFESIATLWCLRNRFG